MSLFRSILEKIFPADHPAVTGGANVLPTGTPAAGGATGSSTANAGTVIKPAAPAGTPATAMPTVDVEAILQQKAASAGQPLNWKTSIVDLLKVLQLDSSLASRQALARELHYTGDVNDSASMNVWLHQAVMQQLAAHGGQVPAELHH